MTLDRLTCSKSLLMALAALPALVLACSGEAPAEEVEVTEEAVVGDVERMQRNEDGTYDVTCRDGRVERRVHATEITSNKVCNAPPAESMCTGFRSCGTCTAASACKWCDGKCTGYGTSCSNVVYTRPFCAGGGSSSSGSSSSGGSCTPDEAVWYTCMRTCESHPHNALREITKACSETEAAEKVTVVGCWVTPGSCRLGYK